MVVQRLAVAASQQEGSGSERGPYCVERISSHRLGSLTLNQLESFNDRSIERILVANYFDD